MTVLRKTFGFFLLALAGVVAQAADIDPARQKLIDVEVKKVVGWAAEPAIVKAVREQNQHRPPEIAAMTQEQWAAASVLESAVRAFARNAAAEVLKANRTPVVSEAFISDADGFKVAFLAKPSNWSHKGKPKHDVPMSGKQWQGKVEVDASTGIEQVQVAVPVLDGGKPIGSLVVGLVLSKLGQ